MKKIWFFYLKNNDSLSAGITNNPFKLKNVLYLQGCHSKSHAFQLLQFFSNSPESRVQILSPKHKYEFLTQL